MCAFEKKLLCILPFVKVISNIVIRRISDWIHILFEFDKNYQIAERRRLGQWDPLY